MERRKSLRKRTATKIYLHHRDLPLQACTTRDLSQSGVFVLTPDAQQLQRGTPLLVTFAVELGGVSKLYQLSGVVARVSPDGVGVVFDKPMPLRSGTPTRYVDDRPRCEVQQLRSPHRQHRVRSTAPILAG